MNEANIGRRGEARLRVRLDARVITLDGTGRAVLADVSTNGARIVGATCGLRPGQEAVLQWGDREAFGVVVWSGYEQLGLRFHEPLDGRSVLATREMDERHRLPGDHELTRRSAQAFVQGGVRL